MKDELGDRMKDFYEDRTRFKLARRSNTIIRIDGKAFHTYTQGLKKPFDEGLIEDMNSTTEFICKNIQGAKFGYVQSDEISILLTDYDNIQTDAWFDGNLQKMASVSASMATSIFNKLRYKRYLQNKIDIETKIMSDKRYEKEPVLAMFDARVFQIHSQIEVVNYFIWRQQDATRNSISSVAQANFSSGQLKGVKTNQMQDMLMLEKGINWNDFTPREKRGAVIRKVEKPMQKKIRGEMVNFIRNAWETDNETPIFTQNKDYLLNMFPK